MNYKNDESYDSRYGYYPYDGQKYISELFTILGLNRIDKRGNDEKN